MEYKYHVIALIIIIFLICIIYPPQGFKDCDSVNETDARVSDVEEYFDPSKIPSNENIRLLTETCASQLAEATYSNVIYPCSQISNAKSVSTCITGYTQYYDMIIRNPVADMYSDLKNLEGGYQGRNPSVNSEEEYTFIVEMANAYSRALTMTVDAISKNYGFAGFNNQTFIQVLKAYLVKHLSEGVVKLYTDGKKQKNTDESSTDIVHQSIMEEIHQENIITQKPDDIMYLKCDDIRNKKIKVYIDGMELSCKNA